MAEIGDPLSPDEVAAILRKSGAKDCTADSVRADIADGAPALPNGTMRLIAYVAWMESRVGERKKV